MRAILIGFWAISACLGADDAWSKVKALKSGTEIRVFQAGTKEALAGKIDEADDDRLVLVLRNEQKSITKADIERLEARPGGGRQVTKTTSVKNEDPAAELARPKCLRRGWLQVRYCPVAPAPSASARNPALN